MCSLSWNHCPNWTLITLRKLGSKIFVILYMRGASSPSISIHSRVQCLIMHSTPMKTCLCVPQQERVRPISLRWQSSRPLSRLVHIKMSRLCTFPQWKPSPMNLFKSSQLNFLTWKPVNPQVIFNCLSDNLPQQTFWWQHHKSGMSQQEREQVCWRMFTWLFWIKCTCWMMKEVGLLSRLLRDYSEQSKEHKSTSDW